MKKYKTLLLFLIICSSWSTALAQRNITVSDLVGNINFYLDNSVRIEGVVDRHVSDSSDLGDYYLRDIFGDIIRIRTHSSKPQVNETYVITGTFEEAPSVAQNRQFYIRELTRSSMLVQQVPATTHNMTIMSSPSGVDVLRDGSLLGTTPFTTRLAPGSYNFTLTRPFYDDSNISLRVIDADVIQSVDLQRSLLFYLIIGLVIILILLVVAYLVSDKRSQANEFKPSGKTQADFESISQESFKSAKPNIQLDKPASFVENPTIKFQQPVEKTVKIVKGKFKVLEGLDDLKYIQFYQNPNRSESEYTFGRNPGDDIYHFQLKSPTVSRNQAKMIIANDKYLLINYAPTSSNPSIINGSPMTLNGSHELKSGDIVEMGNVKMQFSI